MLAIFFERGIAMARKKVSFTFNWFWILILIGGYNMIFDDDKNEVEVVDQDQIVQSSPAPEGSTLRDSVNQIREELKIVGNQLKEEATVIVDDLKNELSDKSTQASDDEKKKDPKDKKQPEMIAEPETLKPLNDAPDKNEGMKKL